MTIAVNWDVKRQTKQKQMDKFKYNAAVLVVFYSMVLKFYKEAQRFCVLQYFRCESRIRA